MREMKFVSTLLVVLSLLTLNNCQSDDQIVSSLQIVSVGIGTKDLSISPSAENNDVPITESVFIAFSDMLDESSANAEIKLMEGSVVIPVTYAFSNGSKNVILQPISNLNPNTFYTISISSNLKGSGGNVFSGASINFKTEAGKINILSWTIGGTVVGSTRIVNVPQNPEIIIQFDKPVDVATLTDQTINLNGEDPGTLTFLFSEENKTVSITSSNTLDHFNRYQVNITNQVKGALGETLNPVSNYFYTAYDPTPKFPILSDDDLLTLVQEKTFNYFWNFGHPVSGMARERNTSGDVVTSGGSGFGLMAMVVAIERGFITREEGIQRLTKIISFLETADRFHGAWSHWINGSTGKVIPFSTKDNGGDLVETSFLVQGLLTFRQYLNANDVNENILIQRITSLWEGVEWDWYRKNNEEVLYWHWSPTFNWEMNFPLYGYFEEQITYVLAAASPTHSIPKSVYTNGYGRNGAIKTSNTFYSIQLPLGEPSPLFWVHYSYLGLNPHFSDAYANYWEQNVNASQINYSYCIANPKKFVGYGDECWGLTSSDNQDGYSAHSPGNDLGVITPTAALSSFPYTPEESMKALKFFYYILGDKLWGEYGFYDAFNVTEAWTADSYLAIDQGPIIIMIENYRTGLLWNLFMSCPEVQTGTAKLGFVY